MGILITGFEPFGPVSVNPSQTLLARLPSQIEGSEVHTAVLPVDSAHVRSALDRAYRCEPEVALHLGVARERNYLSLELVARNHLFFDIPDNAGRSFVNQPIEPGGPDELETRIPVQEILQAWTALDVPCELSDDAGLYLCNQAFYLALRQYAERLPIGFLHLAPDEEMQPEDHVPLALQAEAVVAAARLTLRATRAQGAT